MKTKSISLSVVKNLGNFQTVRYSIEIETETATEAQAFRYAKKIIEQAHHDNYGGEQLDEKEILDVFRQMKLSSDYNKFRFYNLKVEALIEK